MSKKVKPEAIMDLEAKKARPSILAQLQQFDKEIKEEQREKEELETAMKQAFIESQGKD